MSMMLLLATLLSASTVLQAAPRTQYAVSTDGTRIAYDVTGSGPVVILLHGGGATRRSWHEAGYVSRLAAEFTVVTMDLRGNGESGRPPLAKRPAGKDEPSKATERTSRTSAESRRSLRRSQFVALLPLGAVCAAS